ncbi:hypothetical protein AB1Y20_017098 [Prymnesium parvum]|uniref:Uncharacterized protein n=1 Tax=Prymnesium parvum TaxID=97485 RepID=A0AB34I801_PRYPA|mmetsp:Transcript_12976/g.19546  ORF Transcript_12976/g.19546 Transcript_12976/m.19546 type:complete len:223 (+) Transcript_12976:222-890(+)
MLTAALTFLYGEAVASLYTFHSYRSGLATALHAAGVSDALIQLICRWMCPESLHVYRRIGTREHEGSIRKASSVDVDVLQSVNAPKVSADAGFGELVSHLQGPRGAIALKEFEQARATADTSDSQRAISARAGATSPARTRTAAPPAWPPARVPLSGGAQAFIAREHWPRDACTEHGGAGWTVTVCSCTKHTALVAFSHARDPAGLPFKPVRVPLHMLRTLD